MRPVQFLKAVRRAVDGNPFDPADDPDLYRRWAACSAVCSGTATTLHFAAHECQVGRNRHAAAEGIDR